MKFKKILSMALVLCMCLSFFPGVAFAEETVTVTFKPNGGAFVGGFDGAAVISKGEQVNAPEVARDGYEFTGWNLEEVTPDGVLSRAFSFDTGIDKDITLVATWNAILEDGVKDELEKNGAAGSDVITLSNDPVTTGGEPVAEVNGVQYNSLADAIAAANETTGATITLLQDSTSEDGYEIKSDMSINTAGKTITVTSGSNVNSRAFKITSGKLTVYGGGTIDAQGQASATTGTTGTGCYGAFRAEIGTELELTNVTLKNYRPWGLNVKVLGATAKLENVNIISVCGGGIEVTDDAGAAGTVTGYAELKNCTMSQHDYRDWCSVPVSVSGNSTVDVYDTSYTGEYGAYVFSSGGTINIYGGTWEATSHAVLITSYDANYAKDAVINVYGGSFSGPFSIGKSGHEFLNISGGTFDHDPTDYLASGCTATKSGDVWTVSGPVAKIGDTGYATLPAAIAAANTDTEATAANPVVVNLLKDTDVGSTKVEIKNHVTLDGHNHTLTTNANRAIWVDKGNVTVTVKNLEIASGSATERAIQVNTDCSDVNLTIDNVTATATMYTVNICNGADNLSLTVKDSKLTGWGVINLWGANGTVTITGSTLTGINDKTYDADGWNDFGTVVIEGDTTGQTGMHATAFSVSISDTTIKASQTTGNHQTAILYNNPSVNNAITLTNCSIELGENCSFLLDQGDETTTKLKGTTDEATGVLPVLPDGFVYVDVEDDYKLVSEIVAEIDGVGYPSLQDAFDAAVDDDTIVVLTDIDLPAQAVVDSKTVTLDLGGHNIVNTKDIWDATPGAWSLISVQNGGDLTVYGKRGGSGGTMFAKENDCYVFDVRDGSKLTVRNGVYNGNVTTIYAYEGAVQIDGGLFMLQQLSPYNDYRYLLNCLDANYKDGKASFAVKGGAFQHFDPKNNLAEGPNTNFVVDGFDSAVEDGFYVVQRHVHDYANSMPKWTWNVVGGQWAVTATFTCTCGHVAEVDAEVTKVETESQYTYTAKAFNPTSHVEVTDTREYVKTFTVTYNGVSNTYNYGAACKFSDKNFSDWSINDTVRAKNAKNFFFAVTENAEVTRADATGQDITVINGTGTGGTKMLTYRATWSLPEGATNVKAIIYRCRDDAAAITTPEELLEAPNLRSSDTKMDVRNGDVNYRATNLTQGSKQSIMLQVTYTFNGQTATISTDVTSIAIN